MLSTVFALFILHQTFFCSLKPNIRVNANAKMNMRCWTSQWLLLHTVLKLYKHRNSAAWAFWVSFPEFAFLAALKCQRGSVRMSADPCKWKIATQVKGRALDNNLLLQTCENLRFLSHHTVCTVISIAKDSTVVALNTVKMHMCKMDSKCAVADICFLKLP